MKRKYSMFAVLPVIAGIILLIAGMVTQNQIVIYVGIGVLFGGSFLVAIVMTAVVLIKAFKGDGKISDAVIDKDEVKTEIDDDEYEYDDDEIDDDENDENDDEVHEPKAASATDGRAEEQVLIDKVNSTHGHANDLANADYQMSHVKKAYKNASKIEKAGGCLFVIAFIGCIIGGMILLTLDYIIAGCVVFGCGFALIIGTLIVIKIKERLSLSRKYDPADYDRKTGKVKVCVMSSSSSVNNRIRSVTYRVQLEVEGKTYNTYSHEYYDTDKILPVLVHKKKNIVRIADEYFDDALSDKEISKAVKNDEDARIRFEKDLEAHRAEYSKYRLLEDKNEGPVEDAAEVEDDDEPTVSERDRIINEIFGTDGDVEHEHIVESEPETSDVQAEEPSPRLFDLQEQTPPAATVKHDTPSYKAPNVGYKGIKKK